MKISKMFDISIRTILRNRMRSFLTSLGIIIGVCSVIVMVSVGQGSQKQINERISAMGSNLINVMPKKGSGVANTLTQSDEEKLKAESSYIAAISGVTQGSYNVVGGESDCTTTVMGVEPDYLAIKNWAVGTGDFFTAEDLAGREKIAVLGTTVASKLFGTADPVGQTVRVVTMPFKIVGVLAKKGGTGMGGDQNDVIMVPLDTAIARLRKGQTLDSIAITVVQDDLMDREQGEIDVILRESHGLSATAEADFDIMNMGDIIATASATSNTLTILLAAIACVSLVVGGIGIMNVMLVSVTERTREIGIRMSVGARKRDILFQFLSESVILSFLGGIIGILLSFPICAVLARFFGIETSISPMIVAGSGLFAAVVGIFFGYYPARKAASLYPIDALRHE
jgi:putative ABC transport system permease protein